MQWCSAEGQHPFHGALRAFQKLCMWFWWFIHCTWNVTWYLTSTSFCLKCTIWNVIRHCFYITTSWDKIYSEISKFYDIQLLKTRYFTRKILAVGNSTTYAYVLIYFYNFILFSHCSSIFCSPPFLLLSCFQAQIWAALWLWSIGEILDIVFLIPNTKFKSGKSSCCPLLYGGLHFSFLLHWEYGILKSWFIWRASLMASLAVGLIPWVHATAEAEAQGFSTEVSLATSVRPGFCVNFSSHLCKALTFMPAQWWILKVFLTVFNI